MLCSVVLCKMQVIGLRQFLKAQPLDAHYFHIDTAIKHPAPDRIKPSFCNF